MTTTTMTPTTAMSAKRKRDGEGAEAAAGAKDSRKKQKRGFVVGPDHLPDGTYKRKTQEIKQNLIAKAKLWKDYEKLKKEGKVPHEESIPQPASLAVEDAGDIAEEPTTVPHADRQRLIEEEAEAPEHLSKERGEARPRKRTEKVAPFRKEYEEAQKRKAEAEERRRARAEAEQQRQKKIEERERFRKAMAKARTGGRNGQRKLGRESQPLLEKVKRLMGDSG